VTFPQQTSPGNNIDFSSLFEEITMTSEHSHRLDMKWIALVALVLQNSGLAIVLRLSILSAVPELRYFASTAVVNAEILKFIISVICCYYIDANGSWESFMSILKVELVHNRIDWLKLTVPSLLYTVQNSLQYISMELLSAPVFQVLYQMKIITTAIFSVIILSKRIGIHQWLSVIALAGGVALVQISQIRQKKDDQGNSLAGLISVLLGCVTSGFAGVYFEMVLKSSKASIWLRNIQLSVIGGTLSIVRH
jgi:solute carrier family 35 (UDP-sugar transporter), member A1/2/3